MPTEVVWACPGAFSMVSLVVVASALVCAVALLVIGSVGSVVVLLEVVVVEVAAVDSVSEPVPGAVAASPVVLSLT